MWPSARCKRSSLEVRLVLQGCVPAYGFWILVSVAVADASWGAVNRHLSRPYKYLGLYGLVVTCICDSFSDVDVRRAAIRMACMNEHEHHSDVAAAYWTV